MFKERNKNMDTKISSGFSQNFSGKYQIDSNQEMKTSEACLARDKAVGMMLALNDNDVNKASVEKLNGFLKNEYKANPSAPCKLDILVDDKYDKDFEKVMNTVGQKFSKVG